MERKGRGTTATHFWGTTRHTRARFLPHTLCRSASPHLPPLSPGITTSSTCTPLARLAHTARSAAWTTSGGDREKGWGNPVLEGGGFLSRCRPLHPPGARPTRSARRCVQCARGEKEREREKRAPGVGLADVAGTDRTLAESPDASLPPTPRAALPTPLPSISPARTLATIRHEEGGAGHREQRRWVETIPRLFGVAASVGEKREAEGHPPPTSCTRRSAWVPTKSAGAARGPHSRAASQHTAVKGNGTTIALSHAGGACPPASLANRRL